jgi:hypothetical protein
LKLKNVIEKCEYSTKVVTFASPLMAEYDTIYEKRRDLECGIPWRRNPDGSCFWCNLPCVVFPGRE